MSSTTNTLSSWASLPSTPSEKPKTKIKKGVTIVYPEFIDASKTVEDEYWIRLLAACSKNQFPKGFMYDTNTVCLSTKETQTVLDNSTPQQFASSAITVFKTVGNISSKTDNLNKLKKSKELLDKKAQDEFTNWGIVSKTKNKRTQMFEDYINIKFKQYNSKTRNRIFTQINAFYDRGDLTRDNVIYSDGAITNIEKLYIDKDELVRIEDTKKKKVSKKEDNVVPVEEYIKNSFPDYYSLWEKALKKCVD